MSVVLNFPKEIEQGFSLLSESKKAELMRIITAFVSPPTRDIQQIMDEASQFAKNQGLTEEKLDNLLKEE